MITKETITEQIVEVTLCSKAKAKAATKAIIKEIADRLAAGEPMQLRGLMTGKVVTHKARNRHNPRTGKNIPVPAKSVVKLSFVRKLDAVESAT